MRQVASIAFAVLALTCGAWGPKAAQAQTTEPSTSAQPSIEMQLVAAQDRVKSLLPISAQVQQQFARVNQGLAKRSADGKLTPTEVRAEISSAKAIVSQGLAALKALPPLQGNASVTVQANAITDAVRGSVEQISDLLDQGQIMWDARFRGDEKAATRAQARLQSGVVTMASNAALTLRANKVFIPEDDAVWDLLEGAALVSDGMTSMVSARFGQTPPKTAARELRATEAALRATVAQGSIKLKAEAKRDDPSSLNLDVEGALLRIFGDVGPQLVEVANRLDAGNTSTLPSDMRSLSNTANELKTLMLQLGGA